MAFADAWLFVSAEGFDRFVLDEELLVVAEVEMEFHPLTRLQRKLADVDFIGQRTFVHLGRMNGAHRSETVGIAEFVEMVVIKID